MYKDGKFYFSDMYDTLYGYVSNHYGMENDSQLFTFIEMGKLFTKSNFSIMMGDLIIENNLDPFDGWRLPTPNEWEMIINKQKCKERPAKFICSDGQIYYACSMNITFIDVIGDKYHGILIFPSNLDVYVDANNPGLFKSIYSYDTEIFIDDLNEYIKKYNLIFLPSHGNIYRYDAEKILNVNSKNLVGWYITNTMKSYFGLQCLRFDNNTGGQISDLYEWEGGGEDFYHYINVRLVRDIK